MNAQQAMKSILGSYPQREPRRCTDECECYLEPDPPAADELLYRETPTDEDEAELMKYYL